MELLNLQTNGSWKHKHCNTVNGVRNTRHGRGTTVLLFLLKFEIRMPSGLVISGDWLTINQSPPISRPLGMRISYLSLHTSHSSCVQIFFFTPSNRNWTEKITFLKSDRFSCAVHSAQYTVASSVLAPFRHQIVLFKIVSHNLDSFIFCDGGSRSELILKYCRDRESEAMRRRRKSF